MIYSPPLNSDVLSFLCHPITHEPLERLGGHLSAPKAGDTFAIRAGIPELIARQMPFRHRFWAWVYNRVAFAYDWGVALAWQHKLGGQPIQRQSYLEKIYIQPGDQVLETAVGTGANIQQLPEQARYFGLDISHNMLRICQQNLKFWGREAELVQGDAQYLPFFDNLFDVVYHMGGLQFVSNPQHALTEALRVAKPGGRIWMVDEVYSISALARRVPHPARPPRNRIPSPKREFEALLNLVPASSETPHVELISNGELYILSFRKSV